MSSTVGSATNTGWNRRARAASFSTFLRYSSSVVAPTQCRLAAGQRGLEQVGRIHRAFRLAGADQRVHLVDEKDDHAFRRRDLRQHGLEPLLELTTVFRTGDQRAHVERQKALVVQAFGHVAIDDAQGKPFDDRGLANARLADQHGIVLGPPGQHLDGPADLLVASDHGIELAGPRVQGQVARIALERVVTAFRGFRIRGAAAPDAFDRLVEPLGRDPGRAEYARRAGTFLHHQRLQHAFDRDEPVAGLFRERLGGLHDPCRFGRQIDLAGSRTLDPRLLVERRLDRLRDRLDVALSAVEQAGGQALFVVDQNFEKMFRRKPLMAFPQRQ